jgi:hypothetical protein
MTTTHVFPDAASLRSLDCGLLSPAPTKLIGRQLEARRVSPAVYVFVLPRSP